ncbi:MAG: nucleotidyltransferase [Saprospiraceae bacterium]|nr:nucleotidyltransferase [Saprospiraceae bacterium]NNL93285.1 nucleotidyltransferase [Saprospiraceae bacterium]
MKKDTTLLILAAGMGSRYGSLKQMDAFGPHGETIIDYSIYDAIEAGFTKIVFIVRAHFHEKIEKLFKERIGDRIEMVFVDQKLKNLPEGFKLNPEREKPWGTAHAVLVAKDVINEPFAIINADDYYGKESYKTVNNFLTQNDDDSHYTVISYLLKNTLSEHGSVNRGICMSDENQNLTKIVETLKIFKNEDGSGRYTLNEKEQYLDQNTLVSMNMFGFYPNYFKYVNDYFKTFLRNEGDKLKSEFFIPFVLDQMIKDKLINVKVLTSPSTWFGVTYKEDKPIVMGKIQSLIDQGVYPEKLW